jgi:hypothetical protein
VRSHNCLSCHLSWDTLAVPGPLVLTTHPRRSEDEYANGGRIDHGSPLSERWGGWYVTGTRVPNDHLGNIPLLQPDMPASGPPRVPAKPALDGEFDLTVYPSALSDVVALMMLEHQAHATNLITRAGWEYRLAAHESGAAAAVKSPRVREAVESLVDYFLFVDEAPLPSPVRGSPAVTALEAAGPRDSRGRSLRELQLDTRMMRYPCSYMIYSPGFDGLPDEVRAAIYRRIVDVLSSGSGPAYARLSAADRSAILEILRDTKPDFAATVR